METALNAVEALGGRAQALATLPAKAGHPALVQLALRRGLPLRAVEVRGVATSTRSARIEQMHGTGSVAEAAALAAAGPGARITVARITASDGMAACAMAATEGTSE
jgi:cobalt-precorrin 5A hydrolase